MSEMSETERAVTLEPPDRISLNPAVAARYPISDKRIGDVEYVRTSVVAPQGDVLHWQLKAGVEETMCGVALEAEEGIKTTLLPDAVTCKACDAAAWGYKCGRADAATSVTAPVSTGEPKSLLRDLVKVDVLAQLTAACPTCNGPLNACDCMPPLIVTRDGARCADQAAALEEFKERCRAATSTTPDHERFAIRDDVYDAALGELCDPDITGDTDIDTNTVAMQIADKATGAILNRRAATPKDEQAIAAGCVYCHECSIRAAGDNAVYHQPPVCAGPPAVTEAGEQESERHPEDFCEKCGRPNIVWFAPNALWNQIVRAASEPEILCPVCFVQLAEAAGMNVVWEVAPQNYHADERKHV